MFDTEGSCDTADYCMWLVWTWNIKIVMTLRHFLYKDVFFLFFFLQLCTSYGTFVYVFVCVRERVWQHIIP